VIIRLAVAWLGLALAVATPVLAHPPQPGEPPVMAASAPDAGGIRAQADTAMGIGAPREGADTPRGPREAVAPTGAAGRQRGAAPWTWLVAAAVVLAAIRARRTAWSHRRTIAAAGAGALTLVATVAATPHLVHHAFDPDGGASCEVLQIASHGDGIAAAPEAPGIPVASTTPLPPIETPRPRHGVPAALGRAPPA
jgi:hypothetical protein